MELSEFLKWLGTSAGASVVVSFLFERMVWFQSMPADKKKWVFFVACSILSVASFCVLTFVPAEVLSAMAPYFGLIATNFAAVFAGEIFHKYDKVEDNFG